MARKKPPVVLISGSRYWKEDRSSILERELSGLSRDTWVLHGGQRRKVGTGEDGRPIFTGVDYLADRIAIEVGHPRVVVPFISERGPGGGPYRNSVLCSIALALQETGHEVEGWFFHDDIEKSKGTKDCRNKAERMGIPCRLIEE